MENILKDADDLRIPRFMIKGKECPFFSDYIWGYGYCADFYIYFYVWKDNVRTRTRVKTKISQLDYWEDFQTYSTFKEAVYDLDILSRDNNYVSIFVKENKKRIKMTEKLDKHLPTDLCHLVCDYLASKEWLELSSCQLY